MKLPEIQSIRKLRDTKIILLFSRRNMHPLQIASQVNISVSQVYRILQKHSDAINHNIKHQKNLRIVHLNRMMQFYHVTLGNRTTLDIIKELRAEHEGEKGVNVNTAVNVTVMPSITLPNGQPKEYQFGNRLRDTTHNT